MKRKLILKTIFVVIAFSLKTFGQGNPPTTGGQEAEQQKQQALRTREQAEQARRRSQIGFSLEELTRVSGGMGNPIPSLTAKLNKTQKAALKPDEQDLKLYQSFLKQPNTGLIKLFPDLGCEENSDIVRVDDDCSKWIPNSGFYSFRRKKHISEFVADIKYKKDFFISEGIFGQGMMIFLDDASPETLSLSNEKIQQLTSYDPQPKILDVQEKTGKISVDALKDYSYKNSLEVKENTNYALRVIAYRGSFYNTFQGKTYDLLLGDTRKDIIVAFRVIRKNPDGSVTILWKKLNRQDSLKLTYPKKNKGK